MIATRYMLLFVVGISTVLGHGRLDDRLLIAAGQGKLYLFTAPATVGEPQELWMSWE